VTATCFYQLRHIRRLVRLTQDLTAQHVLAFVLSRLDHSNSCLVGRSTRQIDDHFIAASTKRRCFLIMNLGSRDYVTSALAHLHWLPVHYRVQFKLCTMMYSIHTRQDHVFLVQGSAVNQCQRGLCSEDSTEYRLPRCHSSLSKRAFSLHWTTCLEQPYTGFVLSSDIYINIGGFNFRSYYVTLLTGSSFEMH